MPTKPKLDIDKHATIYNIWTGRINNESLPVSVYEATSDKLKEALYKGFKGDLTDFAFDSPDLELLKELRENIYMFSGAKTFQQTYEMSSALVDEDGLVRSFRDFEDVAGKIFDTYNEDWLASEYNTSIASARSAAKQNEIQSAKDTHPYLRYSAVMDEHTCEICAPCDNITLLIDDPFWGKFMPPQHFNCECVVEQMNEDDVMDSGGLSDQEEVDSAVEMSSVKKNPLFDMNSGKDKVIFKDTGKNKHPYFEIPERYRELAKQNFGLPIPDED